MRRLTLGLSVLAVLQLGVAGTVWLGGSQAGRQAIEPLVDLEADAIKTIEITSDPDERGVRLKRTSGGWQLPSSDGFPAKQNKAEELVRRLAGIEPGMPVASSASALGRFDLEDGQAERRIVINPDQSDSVTLLIGKSAGTNSVYARRAGRDTVHEIEFASWQAEASASAWFETDKLQIPITDVKAVEFGDFTLRNKQDGGWGLEGADPDGEVQSTKIKELVAQLVQPTFDAVSKVAAPESEPVAGYTVVTNNGDSQRFDYYAADDNRATLVRSGQDWRYSVSFDQLNKAQDVDPAQFVPGGNSSGDTGSSQGGDQSDSETKDDQASGSDGS